MFDTGLLWSPSCCLTTLMTSELLVLHPKENKFISPTPTIPRIFFICVDLNRMHSLKIWRIGRKWTWVRTLWAAMCRGAKWSVWMLLHAFSLSICLSLSPSSFPLPIIPLILFLSLYSSFSPRNGFPFLQISCVWKTSLRESIHSGFLGELIHTSLLRKPARGIFNLWSQIPIWKTADEVKYNSSSCFYRISF